jgi:cytidylate kinase
VDGPAGTGKSTLARRLAQHFGWRYIDSGAMYRAVALYAAEAGVSWGDEAALTDLCRRLRFAFHMRAGQLVVCVEGRDVSEAIRAPSIGEGASRVASLAGVRAVLVDKLRQLGGGGGLVMDGRDIGSVVFPEAEVKFYLDASPEARGRRRWLELQHRGEAASLAEVIEAIRRRDHDDRTRQASPLRVPADAHYIDTTNLSIDEAFALMVDKVKFSASPSALPSPARERDAQNPQET